MRDQFQRVSLVLAMLAAGCGGQRSPFTSQIGGSRASGGDAHDFSSGIAADRAGHVHVAGTTDGSFPGFASAGGSDAVVVQFDDGGAQQWTQQFGTDGTDRTRAITTDGEGNVYVAGTTDGSFPDFTAAGQLDVFVVKLDGSGTMLWTRQIGTAGNDDVRGLATDGAGNVYVAGITGGSFPGFSNPGNDDMYVLKLSAGGVMQWVQQPGSAGSEGATGVAVDGNGGVILVAHTDGTFPGSQGVNDGLVIKYDGSGAQQWIRALEAPAFRGFPTGVTTDGGGNICVTAGHSTGGGHVTTITRLDPAGTKLWRQSLGRGQELEATHAGGVAVDGDGTILVTGQTNENLTGEASANNTDILVARYAADGTQEWLTQYRSPGWDTATGVTVAAGGSLFVSGFTKPEDLFKKDYDLLLMKFDSGGHPLP